MKKLTFFLLLISVSILVAQKKWSAPPPTVKQKVDVLFDSLKSLQQGEKHQPLKVIVEFDEEPLFLANHSSAGFRKSSNFYEQRFSEFASALNVSRPVNKTLNKTFTTITKEYYKAFFGVQLSVHSDKLADIVSLPYVKAVHFDREVKATLHKSVPQIGADQVWQTFGKQGEGVKVGIIDTGIDYLHPALGGGLGPSFKVAGGYDFVNFDDDPMDDNGHGTHVAGIVSASSPELKGVAPKSTLYAYKVLDANGSGSESDIISAIERVVDPNDDGDMSDKLDVVNVSLGSDYGNPNDASAVAVNNASKLGVIFVIAAGNSGYAAPPPGKENNYYFNGSATLGSPGTAESAITVGAVDATDILAQFSSKGPNRTTFGIKPEIVAPGMFINSTYLNNTTAALNGTSMATPMVTGVVALLKSIYPLWSAERIKSSLINTAKDIGLSAYKQGGGRVRALKAASSSSWSIPAVLNLGLDEPSVTTWTRNDTLTIYNAASSTQNYSISVSGLQSGISINVSPSTFSIPQGSSTTIVVTTTVNNSTIPIVADNIPLYTGKLIAVGSVDTLSIPWAFARANRLTITFNEPMPYFLGTNVEPPIYGNGPDVSWKNPMTAEVFGFKKGTYDFYTIFHSPQKSKMVIKESVTLNNDAQTMTINSTDAVHPIVFRSKDHNGALLSSYPGNRKVIVTTIPNWGDQSAIFEQASDTIMVSSASSRYKFRLLEYHFNPAATKSFHIAQYSSFTAMSSGKMLTNTASDYISQQFKFQFPPDVQQGIIIGEFFQYMDIMGQGYLNGIGFDFDSVTTGNNVFSMNGYFQRSLESARDVAVRFYVLNGLELDELDMETLPVMTYNDSVIALTKDNIMATVPRSPSGGTMTFGAAPVHLATFWYNNWFAGSTLHFSTLFRGVHREKRYSDVNNGTYAVFDMDENLIFTSPLNDFPREPKQLQAQRYKMVITSSSYWLNNVKGKIIQTSEFNLAQTPANPPTLLTFMTVNEQGQPSNVFQQGGSGSLLFSSEVNGLMTSQQVNPDSTKAWFRVHGTTNWIPLPVQLVGIYPEKDGTVFKANIASALTLDSVAIDLRVFVKDSAGFTNEFQIEPAFAVGDWNSSDPTPVEEQPAFGVPKDFVLYQNYPNPFNPTTTIRFGLPQQSSVQVEIFNLLGQRIDAIELGNLSAGYHSVRWTANTSSGVYFYRVITTNDGVRKSSLTKKMLLIR